MYAALSDIHGNLFALEGVAEDLDKLYVEGSILLGDLIDYGMQSDEVIDFIKGRLQNRIISSIWGNHERAILMEDFTRFSSKRGVDSARHTADHLSDSTKEYLDSMLISDGIQENVICGKKVLSVHGSLTDHYWKSVFPDNVNGDYHSYDFVLSGHSHYSHCFQKFYECDDPERRNKHAVTFINPGSVGQPRNHNPNAQYAIIDFSTGSVILRAVKYDVDAAMGLFDGSVDDFYRVRLKTGV